MPRFDPFRRLGSAGLAVLVLVRSLTCMTVACKAVCAAQDPAATAAGTDLPPCHRGPGSAPEGPAGGCDSGSVCCSTWLHDKDGPVLVAPGLARDVAGDPALGMLPDAPGPATPPASRRLHHAADPPDPRTAAPAAPRAPRGPPAA